MGHENWPWPKSNNVTPAGQRWWSKLTPHGTIAQRVKRIEVIGDVVLLAAIGYLFVKVATSGPAYQTKLSHLNGHPPALIAQDFDFSNASANRTLDRSKLQEYREELAAARSVCVGTVEEKSVGGGVFAAK